MAGVLVARDTYAETLVNKSGLSRQNCSPFAAANSVEKEDFGRDW
jgi:hypothetical protein